MHRLPLLLLFRHHQQQSVALKAVVSVLFCLAMTLCSLRAYCDLCTAQIVVDMLLVKCCTICVWIRWLIPCVIVIQCLIAFARSTVIAAYRAADQSAHIAQAHHHYSHTV